MKGSTLLSEKTLLRVRSEGDSLSVEDARLDVQRAASSLNF